MDQGVSECVDAPRCCDVRFVPLFRRLIQSGKNLGKVCFARGLEKRLKALVLAGVPSEMKFELLGHLEPVH